MFINEKVNIFCLVRLGHYLIMMNYSLLFMLILCDIHTPTIKNTDLVILYPVWWDVNVLFKYNKFRMWSSYFLIILETSSQSYLTNRKWSYELDIETQSSSHCVSHFTLAAAYTPSISYYAIKLQCCSFINPLGICYRTFLL